MCKFDIKTIDFCLLMRNEMKGKETKGNERNRNERKGTERKGNERNGTEPKGKGIKGKGLFPMRSLIYYSYRLPIQMARTLVGNI